MTQLNNIPIAVISDKHGASSLGTVQPVLHELMAMLEALIASAKTDSIDLCRAPLGPADHQALKEILGRGEISAELRSLGPTHIQETAISGVWWITHRNQDGGIAGEFIEVTDCPQLLRTPRRDLRVGLRRLRTRLSQPPRRIDREELTKRLHALGLSYSDIVRTRDLNQPGE